MPKIISTSKQE